MTATREIIAIPMGDPAGIGPEITMKSLTKKEIYDVCKPLVVGDAKVLAKAIEIVNA
ncbi:MAG TPA: 4-phospho-D-threonate 3-dehydrogenase, partial [Brevibacillus sp.]|nr:4-phospho-D-threonate 3-dehydrogenase [Brevibacillus sp.]